MDEGILDMSFKMDKIPDSDNTYRLVHINYIRGNKALIHAFSHHPGDNYKLSVDWDRLTTPEESLARFGATYNTKQVFKDFRSYRIFILNTGYVKVIPGIVDVYYDPIENTPVPIGKPNNPAHSLIDCDLSNPENEPELYQKLADHASLEENVDDLKVESITFEIKSQWIIK